MTPAAFSALVKLERPAHSALLRAVKTSNVAKVRAAFEKWAILAMQVERETAFRAEVESNP